MENNQKEIKSDNIKTIELDFTKLSNLEFEVKENTTINIVNNCVDFKGEKKTLKISAMPGSTLIFNNIDITQENINLDIEVELYKNSHVLINNVVLGFNKTSIYNIKTINVEEKSKAYVHQKAVVKDGGEVEFITTGKINKEALYSENFQENLIYLLDRASKGESSPILLIDNNEVKAGHKASVSPVNQDSIYYLQTRGIDKVDAEKLLTHAFIKSLLETMNIDEEIKAQIEGMLNG